MRILTIYIGIKENIIHTLVDMYYNINRLSKDTKENQVIKSIQRLYRLKEGNTCSEHLINIVIERLDNHGPEIPSRGAAERYQPPKEYVMRTMPSAGTDDARSKEVKGTGSAKFRLVEGQYIYRSMRMVDLDNLLAASNPIAGGTYQIDTSKIKAETLHGHAGNLTQAATYGGVMVKFKMRPDFWTVISNNMSTNNPNLSNIK